MALSKKSVLRPALIGFVSACVVVFASAMRGWPFPNLTAEPWFFQLTTQNSVVRYLFVCLFYGAVLLLCWSWVRVLALAREEAISVRSVIAISAAWTFPLFFGVPLFSGDVYVYYVDGQALARGFSPYESGVSAMGADPMVHMVHPIWRHTTTMYGPIFMRMAEGVARATDGSVVAGVLVFRAIAVASVALMGWGVWSLCRRFGRPVAEGLAFALLNPLTLLHLVGGAHNDATMLGLLVAGLAVGVKATTWPIRAAAVALCVAGASFKAPAFAGVLILGWIWAGVNVSVLRRLICSGLAATGGLFLLQIVGMLTALGWGWTKASDVPGMAHPILAPANAFAFAVGGPFGIPYGINSVSRAVAMLAAVTLCLWLVLRTGRSAQPETVVRAVGWALLALAWLGPAVYPWYVSWGVVIIGALGVGNMRRHLIATTILVNLAVAPGGYGMLDNWHDWRRTLVAAVWFSIVIWVARSAVRTTQLPALSRWPEALRTAWKHPAVSNTKV